MGLGPAVGVSVLGVVLLLAGAAKASLPARFHKAITQLSPVSARSARMVGGMVVASEVAVGAWLLSGVWSRAAAAAAGVLLSVFTVLLAKALVDGKTVSCACFGQTSTQPIGLTTVVRNIALVALSALIVARPTLGPALGGAERVAVTVSSVAATLTVVAVAQYREVSHAVHQLDGRLEMSS